MSLETDEAGGRVSGRKRPPTLPSSSQLNSRSLSRRDCPSEFRWLRRRDSWFLVWCRSPERAMPLVGTRALVTSAPRAESAFGAPSSGELS